MVRGLGGVDPVLVREAPQLGLRVKLVGLFERGAPAPIAAVLPLAVPAESHLGGVRGDYNVVVIDGGPDAELVHLGRGAGGLPIAMAALNDLIGLFHPARSWTGRYPRTLAPASAPAFAHCLVRQGGATLITDAPGDGGVPLLGSLIHRR